MIMKQTKIILFFLLISILTFVVSTGCGTCGSCICESCSSCVKNTANCLTCGACTACENSCNACDNCMSNTGKGIRKGIESIGKGVGKGIESGVDAGKDCGGCTGCIGCYCQKQMNSEGQKSSNVACSICGGQLSYVHEAFGEHFISCCGTDCIGCGDGYFHCLGCGVE